MSLMSNTKQRYHLANLVKSLVITSSFIAPQLNVACFSAGANIKGQAKGAISTKQKKQFARQTGSGTLTAMLSSGKNLGQCPLKDTSVTASVSGYVAKVSVKQTFKNPYKQKIEALYTFPLSSSAAIDSMTMKIGERLIQGDIKEREKAKEIYEQAKATGHIASLLDQERPNIFSQAVANIEPGKEVEVTINYIDLLPFQNGKYSFAFPTVVGPRFSPTDSSSPKGLAVPDRAKITPPVTPENTRAGHDISIQVEIDASMPIGKINSALHQVDIKRDGTDRATITLTNKKEIPNRDFILDWQVSGSSINSGYLTYRDPDKDKSGYFNLLLLPPEKIEKKDIAPKEMIFLIDCSGSQSGLPLTKAKETLNYVIDHMNKNDTFQIVSFNNRTETLFKAPSLSTPEMKAKAKNYIKGLKANGGTWMAPAVEKVCAIKAPSNRLRIVTFMTDGYVGNDMEIIGMVKKLRGQSRWFPFGTGNSVNRFIIDGIAREGGGEAEYVLLNTSANSVGKKFYDRISTPLLTDIKVEFNGVKVKEVFPNNLQDLWERKPLYIKGKYLEPGQGTVTLTGYRAGVPYKQTLKLNFPESNPKNPGIASVWARAKVDRLMSEGWLDAQRGNLNKELKDEIVSVALKHHILTQYTSFVAVDKSTKTVNGKPKTVTVPVEMPDGVSRAGIFGNGAQPGSPRPISASLPRVRANLGHRFAYSPNSYRKAKGITGFSSSANMQYKRRGEISQDKPIGRISDSDDIKKSRVIYEPTPKPDMSKKESSKDLSKLAPALKDWLAHKNGNNLTELKLEGDTVKVELVLDRMTGKIEKVLKAKGLSKLKIIVNKAGSVKVEGFASPKTLRELALLSFVQQINAARF